MCTIFILKWFALLSAIKMHIVENTSENNFTLIMGAKLFLTLREETT